jgi:hypothetical protein
MHKSQLRDLLMILGSNRSTGLSIAATVVVSAMALSTSGCIEDTDCGVCDPENLVLEHIASDNYTGTKVHLLQPGVDSSQYFVDDISQCETTEEAMENPRGPEEYCKISPLVTRNGLEMIFNNLLEPTSVEQVRKQPDNPNLFEVYDWKSRLLEIKGPTTRFNGDYIQGKGELPDIMARSVNLSCAQNLDGFDASTLGGVGDPNPCVDVQTVDGETWPVMTEPNGVVRSYDGYHDWRTRACSAPDVGADTCCSVCDYELSVNVAKYGVDDSGNRRNPHEATAIVCDPAADPFAPIANDGTGGCAGIELAIDRTHEIRDYAFFWGEELLQEQRLPFYDMLREHHPVDRPGRYNAAGLDAFGAGCQTTADCVDVLGDDHGTQCVGMTAEGEYCSDVTDPSMCFDKHCIPEWFASCETDPNTTGTVGYCVDRRYDSSGAGACYASQAGFQNCDPVTGACQNIGAGSRIANCDAGESPDDNLSAEECCQDSLGAVDVDPNTEGVQCDPLFQEQLVPVPRFDRDSNLPEQTRDCYCGNPSSQAEHCADQINTYCEDHGSAETNVMPEGVYITKFLRKRGGVVYDPAVKGVEYRIGDLGGQPRAMVEACAEDRGHVDGLSFQDGWRMHDSGVALENHFEGFDRGMCSGSTYEILFSTPDECRDADEGGSTCEFIEDKVGNNLSGKRSYTFATPEFHVRPGSGFPKDNLRIGACDDFELTFSNKYDMDPRNLRKLQLVQLKRIDENDASCDGLAGDLNPDCWEQEFAVAGGVECSEDGQAVKDSDGSLLPCLTVDVTNQWEGVVRVSIDTVRYGRLLIPAPGADRDPDTYLDFFGRPATGRYRMVVPGLDDKLSFGELDFGNAADREAYENAFHDVCGMPLVRKMPTIDGETPVGDFYYDFRIDAPKCKEDKDGDNVALSCDNAVDYFNPDQRDTDLDGFGDVYDLCKLVADENDTADGDKDGVGNNCDNCRLPSNTYDLGVISDPKMMVRNIPFQFDQDQDGIGDVCDNCIYEPNCQDYGPAADGLTPFTLGAAIDVENSSICQIDNDTDQMGDACDPDAGNEQEAPDAAGPVGFDETEDWDQDGIINGEDICPRQPVSNRVTCESDADCNLNAASPDEYIQSCSNTAALDGNRYCNHRDSDGDSVGDFCDTCPYTPNALQVTDAGMQGDDPDGDFVGSSCETHAECEDYKDSRRYDFFEVAVDGFCCSTIYPGDGYYDEDGKCQGLCDVFGLPIQLECEDDPEKNDELAREYAENGEGCRKVPPSLQGIAGVSTLPPGCDVALADAGYCDPNSDENCCDPSVDTECDNGGINANIALTVDDIPDPDQLWSKMCFLPQWDQDFDGLGDVCDLCPFSFDPNNKKYQDPVTGKIWTNYGQYCNGEFDPENVCDADSIGGDGGGGTDDTGGETESG